MNVTINTWTDPNPEGQREFLEVQVTENGTILLTPETLGGPLEGHHTIILHPDAIAIVIDALIQARAAYQGTFMSDVRQSVGDVNRPERWVNPSFEAEHGRKPVAGVDYDHEGSISGDEYCYLSGYTPYSKELLETIPTVAELQAQEEHNLDIVRHPDDPRW